MFTCAVVFFRNCVLLLGKDLQEVVCEVECTPNDRYLRVKGSASLETNIFNARMNADVISPEGTSLMTKAHKLVSRFGNIGKPVRTLIIIFRIIKIQI